jgi:hypothetical protein
MTRIAQCANALGYHEARNFFAYGSNPVQGKIFFLQQILKKIFPNAELRTSNSMLK